MTIDRDTIRHLEALARIELAPGEVEAISAQLGRIVEFVEKLQSVDTTGVEPTRLISHGARGGAAGATGESLRDDDPVPGLDRDPVLGQAPDVEEPFFRVPRVIGEAEEP